MKSYIYIYIYIHVHTYIYIYTYIHCLVNPNRSGIHLLPQNGRGAFRTNKRKGPCLKTDTTVSETRIRQAQPCCYLYTYLLYIYIYVLFIIHTYIHAYIHTYIHIYICIYIYIQIYACRCICVYIYVYTIMYIYIYTIMYIYIYTGAEHGARGPLALRARGPAAPGRNQIIYKQTWSGKIYKLKLSDLPKPCSKPLNMVWEDLKSQIVRSTQTMFKAFKHGLGISKKSNCQIYHVQSLFILYQTKSNDISRHSMFNVFKAIVLCLTLSIMTLIKLNKMTCYSNVFNTQSNGII